jgi:Zn-dependent peptidase ImmA (M78 family)/transcriptional regulator with XRE-family HTH domain
VPTFNPAMVTLAREARGMSQTELAKATALTQGYISKVEHGVLEVPPERLALVAAALRYPPLFFMQEDRAAGASCLHHRKRQSMPLLRLRALHAQVNIARMQAMRLLRGVEIETSFEFPRMDIDSYAAPEEIAQLLRGHWAMPLGPVHNIVELVEAAGGVVVSSPFGTEKLDAISQWAPGGPPFFFVNAAIPGDRLRWTLAHEIGHLVMHWAPSPNQEREADQFAAEFLMPAREIRHELNPLTLPKLAALKQRWKVSMQALIQRAYQLGVISDRQRRSFFMRFGQLGYRKSEPVDVPPERPALLSQVMQVHQRDHGYSVAELSEAANMLEDEFRTRYLMEPTPGRSRLRVVS